jgi:hypothetical protein
MINAGMKIIVATAKSNKAKSECTNMGQVSDGSDIGEWMLFFLR